MWDIKCKHLQASIPSFIQHLNYLHSLCASHVAQKKNSVLLWREYADTVGNCLLRRMKAIAVLTCCSKLCYTENTFDETWWIIIREISTPKVTEKLFYVKNTVRNEGRGSYYLATPVSCLSCVITIQCWTGWLRGGYYTTPVA